MNAIVGKIEKAKPFFDKLAANPYLGAIRDGFLTAMPAILFSSLFILIASIPEVFGVVLPADLSAWLWKIYNLSMGMVALLVAATTGKSLADSFNRSQPQTKQLNTISIMLASICSLLVLAVTEVDGGISITYLGTRGLLCAFIAAFITCHMYRFCVNRGITIPMPPEVPGVISNMFANIFPFSFSVLICCGIDLLARQIFGVAFAQAVIALLQPLFTAADSYAGISLIWGAMAFFWFIGVHGPSIVEPAVAAVIFTNVEMNLELYKSGQHAGYVLTKGLGDFIGNMGGTGATLMVPILFILFARSKQLQAVGKTAAIPCLFGVNEPLLFAAPVVLNPYFFIPFLLAPMVNVCIFKFFVDVLRMNSFMYVIPWSTPAPAGILLGTGFSILALVLIALLMLVDSVIYLPFIKAYDQQLLAQEANMRPEAESEEDPSVKAARIEKAKAKDTELNVLVLCVGAGTSAMFANALKKGADEKGVQLQSQAGAYGSHGDIMKNFDVVVLSPQVQSHYDEVKCDAEKLGIVVLQTKGSQYIQMTRNPDQAVDYVLEGMESAAD